MDPLVGLTFGFTGNTTTSSSDAPRGGSGSQVLPVAEIDVDAFSGVPTDGAEYLYMVRLEAQGLPDVTRVEVVQIEAEVDNVNGMHHGEAGRSLEMIENVPSSRPSLAWRQAFLANFKGFRQRLAELPAAEPQRKLPSRRNVDGWSVFIRGQVYNHDDENEDNDGEEEQELTLEQAKAAALASLYSDDDDDNDDDPTLEPPRVYQKGKEPIAPTPTMVKSLDHSTTMKVLSYLNDWYEEGIEAYDALLSDPDLATIPIQEALSIYRPPLPTPNEATWMMSLLARLDDLLDGNDLSTLRMLCRTLMGMAQTSQVVRTNRVEVGRSREDREKDERDAEGRAACWMVVAAVVGIWKQNDLWEGGS